MEFNRATFIKQIDLQKNWDVIIIGGGATGLGTALDAASRGYRTLLLEQHDFAKGTSSRSTKLVHGGVRYLAQGDVSLVYEALHERGLLLKNAPHLVHDQQFIIPCYNWLSKFKYQFGLKFYDLLAGNSGFKKSSFLTIQQVLKAIPGLSADNLIGGISYSDGQFDDSRLAINLAQTAAQYSGVLINYMQVNALSKNSQGAVTGVTAKDLETGLTYQLYAKTIVNATGVFVDAILKMDKPGGKTLVRPSQGAHIVLDKLFLRGNVALMIPKTADGRVLFAVPWHGKVLVGTTDTPLDTSTLEPRPLAEEIDFILNTAGKYLVKKPVHADILSAFAGLRPLAAPGKHTHSTKEISRSHKLIVSDSGLITITGGKWTTYRKMAEDTIDKAIALGQQFSAKCITAQVKIHGAEGAGDTGHFANYGADASQIRKLMKNEPELAGALHPDFQMVKAEVAWMIRNEMARTIEDVLARRSRVLFLNAAAAAKLAPPVAALMVQELHKSESWATAQLAEFNLLVQQYLLKDFAQDGAAYFTKITSTQ
ncbi:glycerol-3-phosphate dehydrogenase/oxidase [Pedobacter immunditicola]|uniref:glycerol-3-phosphate dehydrogenase/oxidase n=1 Tax=Pedobacter immunditicola TaxID=3133440 RepID=UPI0030A874EA